jgi:Family of unknown function (DUF6084)
LKNELKAGLQQNGTGREPVLGPVAQLDFEVEGAAPVAHAAMPMLGFQLRIASRGGHEIRSVVLDVQIQIAARRRAYSEREEAQLADLFGEPQRWSSTLRTLPWLRTTQAVPGFDRETVVELRVPCTYDFEVTGAKYLQALGDGEVPLELMFGGTVFYSAEDGRLQTAHIGWDREADFRLPVTVWRETMDRYFPNSAWLRVSRDTFDRLYAYRGRNAITSWDQTLESLLPPEAEDA